jgi:hypothetical protein
MCSETKWNILYDIFKFSSCMGFKIIIFTWSAFIRSQLYILLYPLCIYDIADLWMS